VGSIICLIGRPAVCSLSSSRTGSGVGADALSLDLFWRPPPKSQDLRFSGTGGGGSVPDREGAWGVLAGRVVGGGPRFSDGVRACADVWRRSDGG
jgi:hypothetical protein